MGTLYYLLSFSVNLRHSHFFQKEKKKKQAIKQKNLKCIALCERRHSEKTIHCMIPNI